MSIVIIKVIKSLNCLILISLEMRSGRLELPHPKIRVPKTRASTNSATTAQIKF